MNPNICTDVSSGRSPERTIVPDQRSSEWGTIVPDQRSSEWTLWSGSVHSKNHSRGTVKNRLAKNGCICHVIVLKIFHVVKNIVMNSPCCSIVIAMCFRDFPWYMENCQPKKKLCLAKENWHAASKGTSEKKNSCFNIRICNPRCVR